ncbi:hypothetical protein B7P43_G05948 [Cryptotermes secundus]|uniref:Pre-C2HC domain-containing protein n=1 Tax=Cryptotermes secundus TaxID=105785 RepID=A0A2J7PUM5_9NEOP|nr:hypothetical protein B7P43_G05948 [Cryptotermes secundus]
MESKYSESAPPTVLKQCRARTSNKMTQLLSSSTTVDLQLMQEIKNLFTDNVQRSQNEQAWYNAGIQTESGKNFETTIKSLQREISALKIQINNPSHDEKDSAIPTAQETDEEELAPEIEWIRAQQIKRKRKHVGTPESAHPAKKKHPTPASKGNEEKVPNRSQTQQQNVSKPPPIVIENMTNYKQMLNALTSANIPLDGYQSKLLNNNRVKVNTTTAETYRAITALLNNKGIQWHSFEDKQTRDIKVMVKDLHHSIDPIDIVNHFNQQGLKAKNATNKQKWLTAEQKQESRAEGLQEVVPLDIFIVSFDRETDIDKIYNIKTVMNSEVQIEPLRRSKIIPQCKRRQEYGHAHNFCHKTPRFVKCGKQHFTRDCSKPMHESLNARTAERTILQTIVVAKCTKTFSNSEINLPRAKCIQSAQHDR